ncbi:MAG: hypothetical protein K8S16_19455 [Bacteroidales bacterium]|nr:hypothetical protein [Bacteroidales bacterium]
MTKDTYWAQFLKFDLDENYNDYLLFPNYRNAHDGIYTPELDYTYKDNLYLENDSVIQLKMNEIRNSEKYMDIIREKARKKGVSEEQMLWYDAQWIINYNLDQDKKKKMLEGGNY